MSKALLTVAIKYEQDVVVARQRARQIAGLLGFDGQDQTRIATAVSEIARNAFRYAGAGKVEFMLVLLVSSVVLASVVGGYLLSHGHLRALWHPYELLIIGGGALGAFLTANPVKVVKAAMDETLGLMKAPAYRREDYVDLLALLYGIFGVMRKEGILGLETHIEDPQASSVFSVYPRLLREHHLIEFTTDCLRLIVGGSMNIPSAISTAEVSRSITRNGR